MTEKSLEVQILDARKEHLNDMNRLISLIENLQNQVKLVSQLLELHIKSSNPNSNSAQGLEELHKAAMGD